MDKNSDLIGSQYKIQKKINQGRYASIYKGKNIKNGKEIIFKIQENQDHHSHVQNEFKIMEQLKDYNVIDKGIPNIHYFGEQNNSKILILDYLGDSTEHLFKQQGKMFSLKTTLMIADQALKRIQYLHSKKITHNDIKPDNILIGKINSQKIYLIDFGSASIFETLQQHIPYSQNHRIKSSLRYASLNSHMGIRPTRRDDLESLFFCLCYFLKGQLPWQNIKASSMEQKIQKIFAKKMQYHPERLCKDLPRQFLFFINHIRSLNYADKPDYQKLKGLIRNCFIENEIQYDYYYDWDALNEQKSKFEKKNI